MASSARVTDGQGEVDERHRQLGLGLLALGIVYGDIGTSPLYAVRECFFGTARVAPSPENVLGVLSLIFWTLVLVISVKYLAVVMRADNRGEGGILALLALLYPGRRVGSTAGVLVLLGVLGAALLYGDGMITPAISVLSAMEGLEVAEPALKPAIIPMTVLILAVLFLFQRHGTARIGRAFGPIVLVWFAIIGVLGVAGIARDPEILRAVDPAQAIGYIARNGAVGYLTLGGVFLAATGGEALYADMGHFGASPIRLSWFGVVLPALLLNYFGQGALLLGHPKTVIHPFYNLVPHWGVYPMVALATVVTVIASQAVISGIFSLANQAIQMRLTPPLEVVQTSAEEMGQIYLPFVNVLVMTGTLVLVIGFRSSSALAAAYGVAVSGTMVITTLLLFQVMRRRWRWRLLPASAVCGGFLVIDLAFFGANAIKFADGGWVPVLVALAVLVLMTTWSRGRDLMHRRIGERSMSLGALLDSLGPEGPTRVPGTAVFLTSPDVEVTGGLLHHLKINQILHERVILLTCLTEESPRVPAAERLEVSALRNGFYRVRVHYGFMQSPNVPVAVRLCEELRLIEGIDSEATFYFVDHATLVLSRAGGGLPRWRRRLFDFMHRNALRAVDYYRLPVGRSIEIGLQLEL